MLNTIVLEPGTRIGLETPKSKFKCTASVNTLVAFESAIYNNY